MDNNNNIIREFKLTTFSLKNKVTIIALTVLLILYGAISYISLPKELFPDMALPYVMVQTVYPGNPPVDIENLITRPIEKEIESIKGIKYVKSTSSQDASSIFIEFNPNVNIKEALVDVKDAVDNAKADLPNDLPQDPMVMDIDFSEFPIININLSGDYSIDELNNFAEILEDRIEAISEISKVNIQGISEKEIQVNVDIHKLESFNIGFGDIESAIAYENMSISGGELNIGEAKRSVRIEGEFKNLDDIKNIIVKNEDGNIVYLRDVAEITEGYEEQKSITRLNQQPVVSVQVVKKSGENLLSASENIFKALDEIKQQQIFPKDLKITLTNDQSHLINKQLASLENSMIMGVIFVVLILFLFLGTKNSLLVGSAIPLSMILSMAVLGAMNYTINMIVLFSLILSLGMLVDNAIVVVENIYRFLNNGHSVFNAVKLSVGEIAMPIIMSTATTLAAFLPLIFWDSIMGEFMQYFPVTLIVVLSSSLFVSLVIIPVISTSININDKSNGLKLKRAIYTNIIIIAISAITTFNFKVIIATTLLSVIITFLNFIWLDKLNKKFQTTYLSNLENFYLKFLSSVLKGRRPYYLIFGSFILVFVVLLLPASKVEFFPDNDPTYINIMAEMPIGTSIETTNKYMLSIEDKVNEVLENRGDTTIVTSVLTNIGEGAMLENSSDPGKNNKGLITISFIDFEQRQGRSTSETMKVISDSLLGKYSGVKFSIEKNSMGPPAEKPINIEVTGNNYEKIIAISDSIKSIIDKSGIYGIEELKADYEIGKPELLITIDRDKARRFGMSTGQIASNIRTSLFGKEVSDYKIDEDEYPIQLRLNYDQRNNIDALMNQKIIFRNNKGRLMQIPIASVASYAYTDTYGSLRRKDLNRVITLSSNVIEGSNADEINNKINNLLKEKYSAPAGYKYEFTGQQKEQKAETMFLMKAFLIAIFLIFILLIAEFNSLVKPLIIMASVFFSLIGVFGGLKLFDMTIVVIMTGIGVVSLAGVVVNNAIVLIDYTDLLRLRKREELNTPEEEFLSNEDTLDCIVLAGKTRLRPVLLTAITTILGLIPMASKIDINFKTLFTEWDPQITYGGDMAEMWAPMSWTVIFGLTFATFLTLVVVPAMYYALYKIKLKYYKNK